MISGWPSVYCTVSFNWAGVMTTMTHGLRCYGKKNFRQIPARIGAKLKKMDGDTLVVACVREISEKDLASGVFEKLGVPLVGNAIEVVPPETAGKYSSKNVNGEEIVRYDLPKETHYNYVEAPNWGDDYNGTHTVALPYEKYPRDFVPPRNTTIKVEAIIAGKLSPLKFSVNEVVKKADTARLLECLNLLQENVGSVDVFPSDAKFDDYVKSLHVAWEILPPGEREQLLKKLTAGRKLSAQESQTIVERLDFLDSLKPKNLIFGTSGMARYTGGLLQDNLVVFENSTYGNALYIMYDDWKNLSKKSRVELLSGRFGTNFDRVVHAKGWQSRVKQLIEEKRK